MVYLTPGGRAGGRAAPAGRGEALGGRAGRAGRAAPRGRGEARAGRAGATGRGRLGRGGRGPTEPRVIFPPGTKVFLKYADSGDIVPATVVVEAFHPRYIYKLTLDKEKADEETDTTEEEVLARSEEVLARRNEVFTADEVVPTTPSDNKRKKAALKSKDLSPWPHSKSRDRRRRMMLDPESRIHSTDLATIHNDTEEFRRRPFKKFQEYYNSLQKKIEKDRKRNELKEKYDKEAE